MHKYLKTAREPMSSLTHLIGAIISIFALFIMWIKAFISGSDLKTILSITVFGISLIALYFASAYYHYFPGSDKKWFQLRKLDHSMIYVLIAGSYTPIVLKFVEGQHGVMFISIIWIIALVGIIIKLCWMNAPRFISTLFYLLMGWAVIFDYTSFSQVPRDALLLIALGGISYSIGAILYVIKKPNIFKKFGFHEIFHIFIMIGSLFHVIAVFLYVI